MDPYDDSVSFNRKRKLSECDDSSPGGSVAKKAIADVEAEHFDTKDALRLVNSDGSAVFLESHSENHVIDCTDKSDDLPLIDSKNAVAECSNRPKEDSNVTESKESDTYTSIFEVQSTNPLENVDPSQYNGGTSLMNLPDESLLHILTFCKPREIKALGFVCVRLSEVCRSRRALWTHVDLTDVPCGRRRLTTYIRGQYLHKGTLSLAIKGYSDSTKGCQGRNNRALDPTELLRRDNEKFVSYNDRGFAIMEMTSLQDFLQNRSEPQPTAQQTSKPPPKLARLRGSPVRRNKDGECMGPRWTLHSTILLSLKYLCPQLTELKIEYCNLDCDLVPITDFPPTLKKLSLKGTRCYDTPISQTYFFKIHSTLTGLESIDVSHCTWLSPSYLLSLSKMPNLKELIARSCYRLGECVAYSSLATRYGFKALEILDIRETKMGDSEVAALGFLPRLRELYLQAPPAPTPVTEEGQAESSWYYDTPKHLHTLDEELNEESDIEDWELPDLLMTDEDGIEDWLAKKPVDKAKAEFDEAELRRKPKLLEGPSCVRIIPHRNDDECCSFTNFVIAASTAYLNPNRTATIRIGIQPNAENGQGENPGGNHVENPENPGDHISVRGEGPISRAFGLLPRCDGLPPGCDNPPPTGDRSPSRGDNPSPRDGIPSPHVCCMPPRHDGPSPVVDGLPPQDDSGNSSVDRPPPPGDGSASQGDDLMQRQDNAAGAQPGPSNQRDRDRGQPPVIRSHRSCILRQSVRANGAGPSHGVQPPANPNAPPIPRRNFEFYDEPAPWSRNYRENITFEVGQAGRVWRQAQHDNPAPQRPDLDNNGNHRAAESHRFPRLANVHVVACVDPDERALPRTDTASPQQLISDYSLLRLGRSPNADVLHIGPDGVLMISTGNRPGSRPDKSTLEKLVCVGFSGVTDRAMRHLAVSAPQLTYIDVRETAVTEAGAAAVPHANVIISERSERPK